MPNNYLGIAQTNPTGTQSVQTYVGTSVNGVSLAPGTVSAAGGNMPHPNVQPYTAINYCIALVGVYPTFG